MPASSARASRRGSTSNTPSGGSAQRTLASPTSPTPQSPMQSMEASMGSMTVASPQLPKPTGPGKAGDRIKVLTNQFSLNPSNLPNYCYRWNADVKRKGDTRTATSRVKRRCLELLLELDRFQGNKVLFSDYEKTLWSFFPITNSPTASEIVEVNYYDAEEQVPRSPPVIYLVKINAALAPLPISPIKALLKDPSSKTTFQRPIQEYEDLLNTISLRFPGQHPDLTTAARGTKVFPLSTFPVHPTEKRRLLGGGLVAIRGYIHKARVLQGGTFLNVNTTCGAFYMEGLASRLISAWQQSHGRNLFDLRSFMKGVKVKALFGDKVRVKPVIGLTYPAEKTFFLCENHPKTNQVIRKKVSVVWWFTETYGITVPPTDVLLDVGKPTRPGQPGKAVYWPASFADVLPGQSYKGFLPLPAQTDAMIRHACRGPQENQKLIVSEGMAILGIEKQESTNDGLVPPKELDLKMRVEMTQVAARRITSPAVVFKNKTFSSRDSSKGQWNITGCAFKVAPRPDRTAYTVITIKQQRECDIKNFMPFVTALSADISKRCAFRAQPIQVQGIGQSVNWPDKQDPVDYFTSMFKHCYQNNVRYCFIILSRREWYFAVKKAANLAGMQTTVSMRQKNDTVRDLGSSIALELLKYNAKTGGVNYSIGSQDFEKFAGQNTMLMGLDVVHPGLNALEGAPSIVGLVHSITPTTPGEFLPIVQVQQPRPGKKARELVERIDSMVAAALKRWQARNNGGLPSVIIFTRDGVSDAQLTQLLSTELPGIRRGAQQVYQGATMPKIFMVATQKRHPVRFYQISGDKSSAFDDKCNPLPGLIVDQVVVSRDRNDWYCTAHKCIQGTSKPCRHTVVADELNLTKDQQEQLLFNLSFVYPRSVTSVSIPAPARLADVLCDRARSLAIDVYMPTEEQREKTPRYDPNIHFRGMDSIHPNLRDTPWFL